jgi:hypothetical protein
MHRFTVTFVALVISLSGCGHSDECSSRCNAKAVQCGAPSSDAAHYCVIGCGSSPTDSQLACVEGSDCSTLISEFRAGSDICGISFK